MLTRFDIITSLISSHIEATVPHPTREVPAEIKKRVHLRYYGGGALVVVAIIAAAFFGVDIIAGKRSSLGTSIDWRIKVAFAVIGSVGTVLWAFLTVRKALALYERGVEVQATVTKQGLAAVGGQVSVTFTYDFEGKTYTHTDAMDADSNPVGGKIDLLIDPHKPSSWMLRKSVLAAES